VNFLWENFEREKFLKIEGFSGGKFFTERRGRFPETILKKCRISKKRKNSVESEEQH